ncbi:MAG TPA: VanZ family protein [Steroidobacteraceae bacterium]|nr:VanZ family protein [Steroidobacteraceae bacterium]
MFRPLVHRRAWSAVSALLLLGVIVGSLVPGSTVPSMGASDKLLHFAAYAFLALWFGGLSHREAHGRVVLGLLLLGALLEVLQGVFALHRTADLRDLLANALGIAFGMMLARTIAEAWTEKVEAWVGGA